MNKKTQHTLKCARKFGWYKNCCTAFNRRGTENILQQPRISEYGGESRLELLISSKCKNMHHENLNVLSTPQRMNCDK